MGSRHEMNEVADILAAVHSILVEFNFTGLLDRHNEFEQRETVDLEDL